MGLRALLRGRRERAAATAEREARLRWVVLRHERTVVLTNRGTSAVGDVRLSVSADGRTLAEGAQPLDGLASVAPGAAARVDSPLTTDTLWLGVQWSDPRHGEQRAVLRTDVFPRQER